MRTALKTLLISLVGLINIASTLLPIWPRRYLLLTSFFPIQLVLTAQHLTLFAGVLMPFLTIVAPRVTASLHPQTVINPQGKILMDTPTRVVFFNGLAAFSGLFFWMLSIAARAERLARRQVS